MVLTNNEHRLLRTTRCILMQWSRVFRSSPDIGNSVLYFEISRLAIENTVLPLTFAFFLTEEWVSIVKGQHVETDISHLLDLDVSNHVKMTFTRSCLKLLKCYMTFWFFTISIIVLWCW